MAETGPLGANSTQRQQFVVSKSDAHITAKNLKSATGNDDNQHKNNKQFRFVGITARSKFGCLQCRRKSVKCGEERPSCRNCLRNNKVCEYKKLQKKTASDFLHLQTFLPVKDEDPMDNQTSGASKTSVIGLKNVGSSTETELENNKKTTIVQREAESNLEQKTEGEIEGEEQGKGKYDDDDDSSSYQEIVITSVAAAGTRSAFRRLVKVPVANGVLDTRELVNNNQNGLDKLDLGLDDNTPASIFIENMRKFLNNSDIIKEGTNRLLVGETDETVSTEDSKSLNAFLMSIFTSLDIHDIQLLELSCIEARKLFISHESWDYFIKTVLQLASQSELLLGSMLFWGKRLKDIRDFDDEIESYNNIMSSITNRSEERKFILASCFVLNSSFISSGDITEKSSTIFNICKEIIGETNMIAELEETSPTEVWVLANLVYQSLFSSRVHIEGSCFDHETTDKIFKHKALDDIPFQGCLRSLFPLMSEIILNGARASEVYLLLLHREKINNYKYTEQFNGMVAESMEIDYRTYHVHPIKRDFTHINVEDIELHLSIYEMYQFASILYTKLNVRRLSSIVPEVQVLVVKLINLVQFLVNCPLSNTFSFPILIAGMNCVFKEDRELFFTLLQQHKKPYRSLSIINSLEKVIVKSWELNPHGWFTLDWYRIAQDMGLELNLA